MNRLHDLEEKMKSELLDLQAEITEVKSLLDKLNAIEPDAVEIRALAATLHAFYSGVERIFLLVAKGIDEKVPQSTHWHRDLLEQMKKPSNRRPAVIDEDIYSQLIDYLGFRHFFRYSYPMRLDWQAMEPLAKRLLEINRQFCQRINRFITEIQNQS